MNDLRKHPTFHRNSMIVAFGLGALVFLFGGIAIRVEGKGGESPALTWLPGLAAVVLIGWILHRALWARPRCPVCGDRGTRRLDDVQEGDEGSRSKSIWRRYGCQECQEEFLVPGLSLDG